MTRKSIATINSFAASGGEAEAIDFVFALGTMVLAPIYGLLLRSFLYDPLASALAGPTSELGAALEGE